MLAGLTRGPPSAPERRINLLDSSSSGGSDLIEPAEHEQLVSGLIHARGQGILRAVCPGRGSRLGGQFSSSGLPRSGTTLIEQILASHPQVHGAGELSLARDDFEAIPGLLGREGEPAAACIGELSGDAARELADRP